jgi:hypothetical protein
MRRAKVLVYDKCGFKFTNFIPESESVEYAAASFHLNGKSVTWRVSKITPTKMGQFVTLWKRNKEGVICPHQSNEATDLYVIHCLGDNLIGQFVFTKEILIQQGVLSSPGKKGKLGFRVYPKWDIAKNKQAQTTQNWQLNYFLELNRKSSSDLSRIHALYGL